MDDPITTGRNIISGLKCAKLPTFLRNIAFKNRLEIDLDIENHWLRQTVRYELRGKKSIILIADGEIRQALENYNKD